LGVLSLSCDSSDDNRSLSSSTSTSASSGGAGGIGGDTSSSSTGGDGAGGIAGQGGSGGAPVIDYSCSGSDCPPCSQNMPPCANVDAEIDGTCCAFGDPLPQVGSGHSSESVDIESDGVHTILCGGFGADVHDVTTPQQPLYLGKAGFRCQRAAFGPTLSGKKHFFIAHHGDSWQTLPYLQTYSISGSDMVMEHSLQEPGVLYEGLVSNGTHLFVAAHDGGLRVYEIGPTGELSFLTVLGGFSNAWKVELDLDFLYVADFNAGLRIVSIADPANPILVDTLPTVGQPRDVALGAGRVFVAMGGFGVDVFDRSVPGSLTHAATLAVEGTAQSVDADVGVLGVAAWNHVATYDAQSLRLLATEKVRGYPEFEQDLGVAMDGPNLHIAEWEGLHILRHRPGFIAPDLWIEEKLFQFEVQQPGVRAVVVRNRGELPLSISGVSFDDSAYSSSATSLSIDAGKGDFFEISYQPPATNPVSVMTITSDDPDAADAQYAAGLQAADNEFNLNVGDTLTNDFSFLDPGGQLSNLQGKVTVLAYFALF
jgi:LVIVD repeat